MGIVPHYRFTTKKTVSYRWLVWSERKHSEKVKGSNVTILGQCWLRSSLSPECRSHRGIKQNTASCPL